MTQLALTLLGSWHDNADQGLATCVEWLQQQCGSHRELVCRPALNMDSWCCYAHAVWDHPAGLLATKQTHHNDDQYSSSQTYWITDTVYKHTELVDKAFRWSQYLAIMMTTVTRAVKALIFLTHTLML